MSDTKLPSSEQVIKRTQLIVESCDAALDELYSQLNSSGVINTVPICGQLSSLVS